MLQFVMTPSFEIQVYENDRGQWEQKGEGLFHGYDGENILFISVVGMQNLTAEVVIVHALCDSPHKIAKRLLKFRISDPNLPHATITQNINEMIIEVRANDQLEGVL